MEDGRRWGHLRISRQAFHPSGHPPYWSESREFSRFEAWLDLHQLAAYSLVRKHSCGTSVAVPRGHVLAAGRIMAERWGWSLGKVQRFVKTMIQDGAIEVVSESAAGTLYRLVGYEDDEGLEVPGESQTSRERVADGSAASRTRVARESEASQKDAVTAGTTGTTGTARTPRARTARGDSHQDDPAVDAQGPGHDEPEKKRKAISWLEPYDVVWRRHRKGKPKYGVMAKELRPLHEEHGEERVAQQLDAFLAEVPPRFASWSRFAEGFGDWGTPRASGRIDSRRLDQSAVPLGESSSELVG